MALGGFVAGTWDEAVPAAGESVGLGDDRIRSVKTTLRQALDSEHVWAAAGGTVGQHRAGSARAFFGPQSSVSLSDSSNVADGRMMIASDTSKLFGAGSGGTVLLGPGPLALSVGSYLPVTFPQRLQLVVEMGDVLTGSGGTFNVTFASAFSTAPRVFATSSATSASNGNITVGVVTNVLGISASAFSGYMRYTNDGVLTSAQTASWLAIGHRAL